MSLKLESISFHNLVSKIKLVTWLLPKTPWANLVNTNLLLESSQKPDAGETSKSQGMELNYIFFCTDAAESP